MKVYLSKDCLDKLSKMFPWIFPLQQKQAADPSKPAVKRFVSQLEVNVFQPFVPMQVEGLVVIPLPVMHGEDLVSFGFAFRCGDKNVVYLSDISRILPETLDYIQKKLPATDVLVLDALHPDRKTPVHYNLQESIELVDRINPKQTLLVGMNCDSFLAHDEMNEQLRRLNGNIQLAYDGQSIEC